MYKKLKWDINQNVLLMQCGVYVASIQSSKQLVIKNNSVAVNTSVHFRTNTLTTIKKTFTQLSILKQKSRLQITYLFFLYIVCRKQRLQLLLCLICLIYTGLIFNNLSSSRIIVVFIICSAWRLYGWHKAALCQHTILIKFMLRMKLSARKIMLYSNQSLKN